MKVREIMTREPKVASPDITLAAAGALMLDGDCGILPVVDEAGKLVGVVTDRDLRHHLFSPGAFEALGSTRVDVLLDRVRVAEIMSTDLITAAPDMSLAEAAAAMRNEKIGSLPVLEQGRVVGIITETDLLRHIVRVDAGCPPECAEIIVSYP